MCGIVGYIGTKKAKPILINGLLRLEYRGYDSAGIATIEKNEIKNIKNKGRVNDLLKVDGINSLEGTIGIGHTRWESHQALILILIWITQIHLLLFIME